MHMQDLLNSRQVRLSNAFRKLQTGLAEDALRAS